MSASVWGWMSANADGVQCILIFLSVIAAFLVIWHNERTSRRKATIDMVSATFFNEKGHESYNQFKNVIRTIEQRGEDIARYAAKEISDEEEKRFADVILRQLNHYELVSLGIKKSVFDEEFYKFWFFSQFMRDFAKLKPFIDRIRTEYSNQAYFCEYEFLADRWQRNRHPVKHPSKIKIAWWVLLGRHDHVRQALNASA